MIDPLLEVLRSVRLKGGVFLDARFTAPWCVHTNIVAEDCGAFPVKPPLLIAYHFVIAGKVLVSVAGEPTLDVRAGELVLLPRNDVHTLASGTGLVPVSARHLIQPSADGGLAKISHGGGGEPAQIVCGFLGSEDSYNPLIATLPRILKLDVREGASREWVEASVRYAAGELTAGQFASSSLMARLSELLFVEAIRQYSATFSDQEAGWLKGVVDPQVGRALAAIHHNITSPWSARFPRKGSLHVAQRLRGSLYDARRHAADPVSHGLASAGCEAKLARNQQDDCATGAGSGLRVRRGLQQGVQAGVRFVALTVERSADGCTMMTPSSSQATVIAVRQRTNEPIGQAAPMLRLRHQEEFTMPARSGSSARDRS